MAKELSRNFRPQQRDIEVKYLDDFGVEKLLYVGLSGPVIVDVDAVIRKHLSEEQQLAENVQRALSKPPSPPAPEHETETAPAQPIIVETATVKVYTPPPRKRKKGKK